MSFRQRAVIEFLVKVEIPAAEVHQRLQRAYGSVCMGASSVHSKRGERCSACRSAKVERRVVTNCHIK